MYLIFSDASILTFFAGAVHAEELLYLWSIAGINTGLPPLTVEGHVMDYMVGLTSLSC